MTDDNDTHEESVLAAEYTLGLLTPGEAVAFEDVLSVDPDMRDHYAQWAADLSTLTDDIAPVTPPPELQMRITETLFGVSQKKSLMSRLGLFGPILAGVTAAAVVLFAVNQSGFMGNTGPIYVAEITSEESNLIVQASYDPVSYALTMRRTAGVPLEGRSQELWLIAGDNPPVSLGVWPTGQSEAVVTVPTGLAALMVGGTLAFTDEPLGGSASGAPTGDVLGAGSVTLL